MKKNIIISGIPRSGTSIIGLILEECLLPNIYEVEPFNPKMKNPFLKDITWYQYYDDNFVKSSCFRRAISFQRDLRWLITNFKKSTIRQILGLFKTYLLNRNNHLIIKDPFAIFLLENIYHNYNILPIVLIKHPAGFIGSLKRVKWKVNLDTIYSQPELVKNYNIDVNTDIFGDSDWIVQATEFWNLVYGLIDRFKREYPNWIYIRIEDFQANPVKEIGRIMDQIGVKLSKEMVSIIQNKTSEVNSSADSSSKIIHMLNRNSVESINDWKDRLTNDEIDFVKKNTRSVARNFYLESEW